MTARWLPAALLAAQACTPKSSGHSQKTPKSAAPGATAAGKPLSAADARHALNRLSFGPRPKQAAALTAQGFEAWLGKQLAAAPQDSPEVVEALSPYRSALLPPNELVAEMTGDDLMAMSPKQLRKMLKGKNLRQHLGQIALAKLTRHVLSEHQLQEVMIDFWTNHFNVFARKGAVRVFAGDYVERAIRPHALGRFKDLLTATARHPAMLIYLDNVRSVAKRKRGKRGLNENYARELMELHTLGVHGGYTQADVVNVARILTGWSVSRPRDGELAFKFRARAHDGEAKRVLGVDFPAGGGEEEGMKLLELLALHPATAQHLSHKLCQRLVSDAPPKSVVQAGAKAFTASQGDIKQLVQAIVKHEVFWAASSRGSKLKSPLEVVASSLRALDARPDGTLRLARILGRLGEPAMLESAPTGHPEVQAAWLGSSAMLGRMSLATALATNRRLGVDVDLDRVLPLEPAATIAERAETLIFGGQLPKKARATISAEVSQVEDPKQRRALALALLLGSPNFQRQ